MLSTRSTSDAMSRASSKIPTWPRIDPAGEALSVFEEVEVGHPVGDEDRERLAGTDSRDADDAILHSYRQRGKHWPFDTSSTSDIVSTTRAENG